MMPILNSGESDPCPCGSGKQLRDCCLETNGVNMTFGDCVTAVAPSNSPYSHPKCYASALKNCSGKLSREHYISNSLLSELDKSGGFSIKGFPWQCNPITKQPFSAKALRSKILCKGHNSALSSLDDIGKLLLAALDQAYEYLRNSPPGKATSVHIFNGHDIERWVLKMLIGLAVSGNITVSRIYKGRIQHGHFEAEPPPLDWLHFLFGHKPFPHRCGLYFLCRGQKTLPRKGLNFRLWEDSGDIRGCAISLCGIQFLLAIGGLPLSSEDPLFQNYIYRSRRIEVRNTQTGVKVVFILTWRGKVDPRRVVAEFPAEK